MQSYSPCYCALCVFTLSSIIKFIYHLFNKCVGDIYCEDEDHKNKAGKSTLKKVKHNSDIAMTTTSAITVQLLSNRNSIIFKEGLTCARAHTHTHTLIVALYHSWYNQTLLQPYNRFSSQWGLLGLPRWLSWQRIWLQCRRHRRFRFDSRVGRNPWRRACQPTSVFLPGESLGLMRLTVYSPKGHKEWDMTIRLKFNLGYP